MGALGAPRRARPPKEGTDECDRHQAGTDHPERLCRVDELDLEPIVYKLVCPEPGETSLSLVRTDQDVTLYRCFLKLCVLYPGTTIVPTRQLDRVWHTHMLDTAK